MFEIGSTWSRWDLHIHTPGTAQNNQFREWEEFLCAIENQNDVRVLGITDYLLITNYSRLKKYKEEENRIPNIDLIIPNIEFRLAPENERAKPVNIHLLISPDDPNHEEKILNALGRLSWEYNSQRYSCLPDQLIALGRAFDPKVQDNRAALKKGVLQYKIGFTDLREWYSGEHWLRANSIVATAAGDDGLSGIQQDGGWAGYREEITRFTQIIFSGSLRERNFWLDHRDENGATVAVRRLGGRKPCIHGSDAHSVATLFRPDLDRFCWIKAAPTFEGLKQILHEPEERVHIGPTSPIRSDRAPYIIRSIKLSNTDGWFDEVEITLNDGLISVIGQKGSGKSALAELIAYAAGSWPHNEPGSFLSRAGEYLQNLDVELKWADNESIKIKICDGMPDEQYIKFLSQRFVERLCSEDNMGSELVSEIEAVIFSHLDPSDVLNASSFDELRTLRTQDILSERRQIRDDTMRLIHEICTLREDFAALHHKNQRIQALTSERARLEKQTPPATSEEDKKLQQQLQDLLQKLANARKKSATYKQKVEIIYNIKKRVLKVESWLDKFASEIDEMLESAGIPADERSPFHPAFPGDIEQPLARRGRALTKAIKQIQGNEENPEAGTIKRLLGDIEELQRMESMDNIRRNKIKEIQTRIATIDTKIERIQSEISRIRVSVRNRWKLAHKELLESYVAYFINLGQEQEILQELYAPVDAYLTRNGTAEHERNLEFSICWKANFKAWFERGSALFDQRKVMPFDTMEKLEEMAHNTLFPAWVSGDSERIRSAIKNFFDNFTNPDFPLEKYMRSGVSVQNVYEWVFDADHIYLKYSIRYNGVDIEKLSPGTKGIVLLILYLALDIDDPWPLIVDQPDENLDNESIYDLLTVYFRQAKRRRQIILITHNPNLVVNVDSEQVIVARAERYQNGFPHISYQSGGIEDNTPANQGIRQKICRILEGGREAFRKRERRYELRNE